MINFKIKSVRFHQAVYIKATAEVFVQAPEYVNTIERNKNTSSLTWHEKGVLIENEREMILVGWPNISCLTFDKESPIVHPTPKQEELPEDVKGGKGTKKVTDFRNI